MTLRKGLPSKKGATDANDTRYDFRNLVVCNADGSPRGGVTSPVGSSIVTATATMNSSVAAFNAIAVRDGGVVLLSNDGPVTVLHDPAPAANSRIDVVYAKQDDSSSTVTTPDADDNAIIAIAKGVAQAAPVKPSIPVGAVELATVQIPAGATATNSAAPAVTITQTAQFTAAPGGLVPVRNVTDLANWTPPDYARALNLADKMVYSRRNGAWLGGIVTPSFSSPYGPAAAPNAAVVYCDNDRVVMEALVTNSSSLSANAGTRYVLGTIPPVYAPGRNLRFAVTSTTLFAIVEVTTTGEIAFYVSANVVGAGPGSWNISFSGASWKLV